MRGEEALSYPLAEENEFDLQPGDTVYLPLYYTTKEGESVTIGASKEEMTGHVPYTGSIDKNWKLNFIDKSKDMIETAELYKANSSDKALVKGAVYVKAQTKAAYNSLDDLEFNIGVFVSERYTQNKTEQIQLKGVYSNPKSENMVDFEWENQVFEKAVWEVAEDQDGTATFNFNDDAYYTVKMFGGDKVMLDFDRTYNKEVANRYTEDLYFYNFRGDRSIEISKAFDSEVFDKFDRVRYPKVVYAGMLEYDGDLHIPKRYLVNPPEITNTMGEYLASSKIPQFAISETQKYGHVTYFWNGNRSGKFSEEYETYVEIPSDVVPFEQRPWMKCAEITDRLIEALESGKYRYLRVNFPNGDMVGHTGNLEATICSMEALDLQLARIIAVVDKLNGVALITADHGNADEMAELDKKTKQPKVGKDGKYKPKTSHTLNRVPCIIYDNHYSDKYTVKADEGKFGLSDVAATMVNLMGYKAPSMWDESLIEIK